MVLIVNSEVFALHVKSSGADPEVLPTRGGGESVIMGGRWEMTPPPPSVMAVRKFGFCAFYGGI